MRDWTTWFDANPTYVKDLFREIYYRGLFRHQHVTTKAILIAGSRHQIKKNSKREKRWAGLNASIGQNQVITYDHLADGLIVDFDRLRKLICRDRRYIANELRRHYQ
jgi:hypothetical protein